MMFSYLSKLQVLICCTALVLVAGCNRSKPGDKTHLNNAEKHFAASDYGSAEVEYKNALRATPGELIALRRLGAIWEARGGPFQAGGYYQRATKWAPRDVATRLGLARSLLALGNLAGARSEALEALKIEPSNGDGLVVLARSATGEAQINDASSRLTVSGADDKASSHLARAILAMNRQDPDAAGWAIERALALDNNSAEIIFLKAKWHLVRNEHAEAEECMKAAVRLAPARSPERVAYASYLLSRSRREEAVALLEKTTAEASDFLTPWRMLAKLAMNDNEPMKAANLLEKVFARDATDFEGTILRVILLLSENGGDHAAKAIVLLDKLKNSHPPSALVEFYLARARLLAGEIDLASAALDRALKIQPEMRDALYLQGTLKLSQGRFDEVASSMEALLRRQPGDAEATLMLAEAYRKGGKPAAAAAVLAAMGDEPDPNVRWLLEKGLVFKELGKTEDARIAFEKAQALEPSNLQAAAELVRLDLLSNNNDSALRRANQQRDLHPKAAGPYYLRASVWMRQAKWHEAEEDVQAALRLEPAMVAAYDLMVRIYAATGKMGQAREQLERMRQIDPGNIAVLMTLGGIHQNGGRKSEARKCYEEILKREREFVPALNNLASLLSEVPGEDLANASRLAELARFLKPDEAAIADTLGWILFKQGDFKRAHSLLGEAADKIPDDPRVNFHYGMACRAMDDANGARKALSEAIAAPADFPGKSEARGHLARLDAMIEPGEAGIRVLEAQIQRDPSDVITRMQLGGRLEADGRPAKAAEAYAGAMAVNPELHLAVSRLAHLYAGPLNSGAKAHEYAQKARELSPGDVRAGAILAVLAFRAGEHERAYVLFQECLANIQDDTALTMQGAWAAYSVGRVGEASNLMETLITRSNIPGELASAKRFLDLVKPGCTAAMIADALALDGDYVPALMARAALAASHNQTTAALHDFERVLQIFPKFTPARDGIEHIEPAQIPDS